jgi:hypothetical protein
MASERSFDTRLFFSVARARPHVGPRRWTAREEALANWFHTDGRATTRASGADAHSEWINIAVKVGMKFCDEGGENSAERALTSDASSARTVSPRLADEFS